MALALGKALGSMGADFSPLGEAHWERDCHTVGQGRVEACGSSKELTLTGEGRLHQTSWRKAGLDHEWKEK